MDSREGKAFIRIFGACTSLVGKVCKDRKHWSLMLSQVVEEIPNLGVQGQVKGRIFFLWNLPWVSCQVRLRVLFFGLDIGVKLGSECSGVLSLVLVLRSSQCQNVSLTHFPYNGMGCVSLLPHLAQAGLLLSLYYRTFIF